MNKQLLKSILSDGGFISVEVNWFNTLNEALSSEGLLSTWDISFGGINYGQTFTYTFQDGSKYGHYISIYRESDGRYERPIHYARG